MQQGQMRTGTVGEGDMIHETLPRCDRSSDIAREAARWMPRPAVKRDTFRVVAKFCEKRKNILFFEIVAFQPADCLPANPDDFNGAWRLGATMTLAKLGINN
jgi:hypothetical protein